MRLYYAVNFDNFLTVFNNQRKNYIRISLQCLELFKIFFFFPLHYIP